MSSSSSQVHSFNIQRLIQLRFLCPDDIAEVKKLCAEWFPIEYPESWYTDITSSSNFYSLAATINSRIVGIIVCELKPKSHCNLEDFDILAPHYPQNTMMAYIMSLGVVKDFRRHGIASLLLDNLLSYLTSGEHSECKVVFLHVLASNQTAIRFYERRNFRVHARLPSYYAINDGPCDGFSYVLYINGGQPPFVIFECLKQLGAFLSKLQPCALPHRVLQSLQSLWRCIVNGTTAMTSSHEV